MWNKDYLQYAANQFKVIVCPSPFRQGRKPRRKCYARAVCSVCKDKGEMQHFHSHMGRNLQHWRSWILVKLPWFDQSPGWPVEIMGIWKGASGELTLKFKFEHSLLHDSMTWPPSLRVAVGWNPASFWKKGNWEEITLTISLYWVGGLQINVK